MKLVAIAQRGAQRDYFDIYALGRECFSLAAMLKAYQEKYAVQDVGRVLYSLTWFDDADREPLPTLLWDVTWDACKAAIRAWVRAFTGGSAP